MRIGDQCTFPQLPYALDPTASGPADRITLTSEAGEILSIILERLVDFPSPQRGALLLSGDLGVDSSRLLHFLECLMANPEYPSWNSLLQGLSLGGEVRPKAPIRSLFIQMPPDPSKDLGEFLMDSFEQKVPGNSFLSSSHPITAEEFLAPMQQVAARLLEHSLGMVVLEHISERSEQLRDSDALRRELRLYWVLSEVFSQRGILTVLLGKQEHLNPEDRQTALSAGGEEFERNYSWIEFEYPSSFALPKSVPAQEEEFRERLQLMIYDWIRAEIPLWQPERGPRYKRDSQALVAAIPDGAKAPAGLVYFKSVFDPYWSDEDLARLQGAAYPWILMILSPCERFYEFEAKLKEMVSRLPMLLIWRPDAPSKMELERLRGLAFRASGQSAEDKASGDEAVRKIRPLLSSLYVSRGQLMGATDQYAIGYEIADGGIGQYLSACLGRLTPEKAGAAARNTPLPAATPSDSQALQWAALLIGRPELRNRGALYAQEQLLEWWNTAETLGKLPDLPEAFRTTRFWSEIKYVENPITALRPVFESLASGSLSFMEAMDRVGRNFAWDSDRLLKWKRGMESLGGLRAWLPGFLHAQGYLRAAFPLNLEKPDRLREFLLESLGEPHRFLEAAARKEFDQRFLEFKTSYMDSYYLLHEDALHVMSRLKKESIKVDPVSLRNLDLLSGLQYMDKSYLNRVKLLAKWIQRNQCNLPLRQILERYPRCYCGFNPCSSRQPADTAAQINGIIRDGIEHFRTVLRRCGHLIVAELKTQKVDPGSLKQITTALSDDPMIPLKPQCIKILNRIIVKYPTDFLNEIRKGGKPGRRPH